jgi:hypothetical protein
MPTIAPEPPVTAFKAGISRLPRLRRGDRAIPAPTCAGSPRPSSRARARGDHAEGMRQDPRRGPARGCTTCSSPRDAEVRIVAASRRHSEIVLKRMKMFARHDLVADAITITYFELRHEELHGDLMVISAEGGNLHGDSPSLIIGDEVWQWKSQLEMLEAERETQIKNSDCLASLRSNQSPGG